MINLNIKNITDEMFALTALRARQFPAAEAPAVLSRDQLPALRIIVRSVFSQLVARLIPYVADAAADELNPDAPQPFNPSESIPLMIDFGQFTAKLNAGSTLVFRRQLEHMLALMTLAAIYEEHTAAHSSIIASSLEAEIEAIYQSVLTFLSLDEPSPVLSVRPYL